MNPVRSLLYVPAARPRMLTRIPSLSADAVAPDLEADLVILPKAEEPDADRREGQGETAP